MQAAGVGSPAEMRVAAGGVARGEAAGVGSRASGGGGVSEVAGDAAEYRVGGAVFDLEVFGRRWIERIAGASGGCVFDSGKRNGGRERMANVNPINEVANLFGGSAPVGLSEEIASIAEILQQLQTEEKAAAAPKTNSGQTSSGGSIFGPVLGGVENFFGLGAGPLISGLVGLFGGGGGASEPPPLVPYIAPPSVNVNAGISASATGVFATDTADGGVARPATSPQLGPQITVQVQALDSQSFLDHSNDIAMAVRQAMLESTTLNDVIREI